VRRQIRRGARRDCFAYDDGLPREAAVSIDFLVTLLIVASPGTGALFTLAAGLSRVSRASVVAASLREHVISRPRVLTWMRRTFADAFAALGAKLALADR
jgi:threonine/homoserine/homoserine lactone efflux protein